MEDDNQIRCIPTFFEQYSINPQLTLDGNTDNAWIQKELTESVAFKAFQTFFKVLPKAEFVTKWLEGPEEFQRWSDALIRAHYQKCQSDESFIQGRLAFWHDWLKLMKQKSV